MERKLVNSEFHGGEGYNYVLVTPARNEGQYIQRTIESVITQSIPPLRWVIVSDGSTDNTEEIVQMYSAIYPFIILKRVDADKDRNFGSKVSAIRAGMEDLHHVDYNYLGFLDADISFKEDYFEKILTEFNKEPRLGLAGGTIYDKMEEGFIEQVAALSSVAGAVQTFRRECYEDIGGYLPIKSGGIDTVAEVMARMRGWKTRSFPNLKVLHFRPTGTQGVRSLFRVRFKQGRSDYCLGYHPVFYFAMLIRRFREKPYFLGSLCRLGGFIHAWFTTKKKSVPDEFIHFLRREQIRRLLTLNVSRT